jgi:glutathione S-transferase
MQLITIPMSHYCEKARWALDHAGLPFEERAHLQGFHYWAVRSLGSKGMVPVLVTDKEVVADSSNILRYADDHLPEAHRLYPSESRREIEALEDYFDEVLGVETRRWVYFHWLSAPAKEVMKTATQLTPRWQQRVGPYFLPLLSVFLGRKLGINSDNVAAGLKIIEEGFDTVAARLESGQRFLVGDQFTAADLSFACMAAPVVLPEQYGIKLPTLDEAPPAARLDILRFRAHPAGQYALKLFAEKAALSDAARKA